MYATLAIAQHMANKSAPMIRPLVAAGLVAMLVIGFRRMATIRAPLQVRRFAIYILRIAPQRTPPLPALLLNRNQLYKKKLTKPTNSHSPHNHLLAIKHINGSGGWFPVVLKPQ